METVSDIPDQARSVIQELADHLERTGRAKAVFGDPVERNGVTVIPVARACWGLGGGEGKRPTDQGNEQGHGGGGCVHASPIGFIEIREGQARFQRIADPFTILAATAGVAIAGLGLRWLFR